MIICILLMGVLVGQAQITLTTEGSGVCYWNEETEHFDKECRFNEETVTKFWFNYGETVLVHTTSEMKSTYYVDSTDHKEDKDLYIYYVTSDVGNKYVYYFDIANYEIRTMTMTGEYLIVNFIKGIFKE